MIDGFKDLKVWQRADEIFNMLIEDSNRFPKTVTGRIVTDQVVRSVGSISANIAEGYGRGSKKEFQRFLLIARGSATESENWLLKVQNMKWVENSRYTIYIGKLEEVRKMINSLLNRLRKEDT